MTAITIGHDSGPPKFITRPRSRWNLGADMSGVPDDTGFKVVVNPSSWQLMFARHILQSQRRLRKGQLFQAELNRQIAELDYKKGPAHLLDLGWIRRNWAQL